MSLPDSICAQATPPGRGGVAMVRVSGSMLTTLLKHLFPIELKPRIAHYTVFKDSDNQVIDECVVIFFPKPHSFTGEDVLEIHSHGSPLVVESILKRLVDLGVRLARPGEFSERAFLNGKMDLAQAEAIADLINASSVKAARSAIRSLQGEFSKQIQNLNEGLIYIRTYLEATLDFSEEEIDFLSTKTLLDKLHHIDAKLDEILRQAKQGSILREGITAVIVGKPNVGKSSLLNKLSGQETAIVTDIPGTTRDLLRESILIEGLPIHIIDTAGLRDSTDIVEQEGIRRAQEVMQQADVILYVFDHHDADTAMKTELSSYSCPVIWIENKIDLSHKPPGVQMTSKGALITLSVLTGAGLSYLKECLLKVAGIDGGNEDIFIARLRHVTALQNAKHLINQTLIQLVSSQNHELAAEDLRKAHLTLAEITGEFSSDDLLGEIFSSFCIGK